MTDTALHRTNTLAGVSLSGVAVSAAVAADGRLHPVGAVIAKLVAAARGRALPRIHTVIVAAQQDLSGMGLIRDPRGGPAWRDPNDEFVVLPAATLVDATTQIHADQGRWPSIECALPARERRFVG